MAPPPAATERARPAPTKLSYRKARELEQLPNQIEALEPREQQELSERMSRADYHLTGAAQMKTDGARLAALEQELAACFDRWAELEARASALRRT